MDRKKSADKLREVPLTYDDYASIDDGNRYELAEGALELLAAPTPNHQLIGQKLLSLLEDSCREKFVFIFAPVDVIFKNNEVRQPDLIAIHRSRLSIITNRGIEGSPNLVIEVLSPTSAKRDRKDKMEVYAHYQVPEYWLVNPEFKQLEQYVLIDGRYQLVEIYDGDEPIHSEKIPCASFSMDDLWAGIPELPNA